MESAPAATLRPGVLFTLTLVLSWTLITAAVALAAFGERDASLQRIATWVSLWVFSVVMPTLNALTLHRIGRTLTSGGNGEPPHELFRTRTVLLLTANMAVLSALALILRR